MLKLQEVEIGRVYKHFKGKYVFILGLAKYYKDDEIDVIYKGLNSNEMFCRDINSFLEIVDRDGNKVARFSVVGDEEVKELITQQELNNLRTLTNVLK